MHRRSKYKESDEDYQNSSNEEEDGGKFNLVPVKREIVEEEENDGEGEPLDFMGEQTETREAGRPKRKSAVRARVQIKEEPCDPVTSDSDGGGCGGVEGEGDSDYLMNEDEEEKEVVKKKRRSGLVSGGKWKRKKVSEMDEEEREAMKAKWREEARRKRENNTRKKCKRKPVSEMSEEERERMKEKWREEARLRRAKKRESMGCGEENNKSKSVCKWRKKKVLAVDSGASEGEGLKCESGLQLKAEMDEEENTWREEEGEGSGSDWEDMEERKLNRRDGRRKLVAEMSEEEREKMKVKWREEARQRRTRKKMSMTEEEKLEEKKKQNEQRKLLRWRKMEAEGKTVRKKKEGGREKGKRKPLTEEEKVKKREWRRKWRENMSEEEKQRRRDRWNQRRRELREGMTVEERRMKDYMDRQARLARMTKEEREEEKERMKRRRLERQGGKEGSREVQRRWRERMSDEQKERFRRQLRESYYRKMDRIKRDPEKLQEWRKKCKEDYQRKILRSLETGKPIRRSRKGKNGYVKREELDSQKQIGLTRLWRKRQDINRRLEIQKMLAEGMSLEEICKRLDPYGGDEEKRQRRLVRQRVNKQKLILKRQLEGMGVAEEEIKRRVKEVEDTYQPTFQFRPFKLHSKSLEPVGPEELKLLEEEEERMKVGRFRTGTSNPPLASNDIRRSPQKSSLLRPPQQSRHHTPQQNKVPQLDQAKQNVSLPHQQTSTSASTPQQPTYSLQNFLHGMSSNYSPTGHHPPPSCSQAGPSVHYPATSTSTQNHPLQSSPHQPPASQHYESSFSSSQHEYPQSDYTNSPPPASPFGGDDHDDNYEQEDHHDYHHPHQSAQLFYSHPPQPPVVAPPVHENLKPPSSQPQQLTKTGRPKKPKRSLPHRKGTPGPPSGPRGPKRLKKEVVRDVICEDCGNAYSRQYINEHKTSLHNPNFVDGKCLVCGEAFTNARHWYRHFLKLHLDKSGQKMEDNLIDPRKRKRADPNVTGLFCELCASGFAHRAGLNKHMYYAHGDGVKKENYLKCHICPEEKLFKSLHNLKNHMRNQHPDTRNEIIRECFRCDLKFRWEEALCEHVKREHAESYFPCKWCKACRFSKYGLYFHLRKCTKGGRTEVIPEGESLLEQDLGCEFCGRKMRMTSMTRHYKEVHGVVERETFKCTEGECKGKGGTGEFKRRDYWVVHLEEKHGKLWEELREWVGRCNVEDREGLVVENEGGRNKKPEGGRRRVLKKEVVKKGDGEKRPRRNIKVIAEEDEC